MTGFPHSSQEWESSHISFRKFKAEVPPCWQLWPGWQRRITSGLKKMESFRNWTCVSSFKFLKSWWDGIYRVILISWVFNWNFHHPLPFPSELRATAQKSLSSLPPDLKEILDHNEALMSFWGPGLLGPICWKQPLGEFPSLWKTSQCCEFTQVHKAVCKGELQLGGFALLPGVQKRW
jgi:hypothetical protein